VNLTGSFLMVREVAGRLVARGAAQGVIVNLSSIARAGNPGQSNYAASKAGLDAAMRTWALELAPHRIRVANIAPAVASTAFLHRTAPAARAELLDATPLGRAALPEEIWLAVRFIIENDYFTGRTVEVDGGASMGCARPPVPVPEAAPQ